MAEIGDFVMSSLHFWHNLRSTAFWSVCMSMTSSCIGWGCATYMVCTICIKKCTKSMCICLFGMWSIPSHEVDKRTISGIIFFVKNIALFRCDIFYSYVIVSVWSNSEKNWISFFSNDGNYTRIFFTISPYRSFLVVIFLLLRRMPIIARINP